MRTRSRSTASGARPTSGRGESLLLAAGRVGLPGTKDACEQGECGSCTVLARRRARLLLPGARGRRPTAREVTTVEGLPPTATPPPLQQAFVDRARSSAASARPASSWPAALLDATPGPERGRDPRGAVGQPLPLHGLREDLRRGPAGRRRRDDGGRPHGRARASVVVGRIGDERRASTASPKITGEFAYASDLSAAGMLWGHTLRSPHAHARVLSIDLSAAPRCPASTPCSTHADVPGTKNYGLEFAEDRPSSTRPRNAGSRRRWRRTYGGRRAVKGRRSR